MKLLHESLKTNFTAVQYCIQYEVLQKKPVFESYRTFCKTLGDDVMDYQEFEFWYMRFYQDQLDMDYDREQDPEPLELSKLPVDIIDKVVKKLNSVDRVLTRHVSKPLRLCVDRQFPTAIGTRLFMSPTYVSISADRLKDGYLVYRKTDDGCSIRITRNLNEQKKFEIRTDQFSSVALNDLMAVYNNPKDPMEHLEVAIGGNENFHDELIPDEFASKFYLKSLKTCSDIARFLVFLKPGVLENLDLRIPRDGERFEAIFNTDQWKEAKTANFYSIQKFPPTILPNFYHFTEFSVELEDIPREALMGLIANIIAKPSFAKCQIFSSQALNVAGIRAAVGMEFEPNLILNFAIYPTNDCLQMHIEDRSIKLERKKIE